MFAVVALGEVFAQYKTRREAERVSARVPFSSVVEMAE